MSTGQAYEVEEIGALVAAERVRLVGVLDGLDEAAWQAPSLCAGWSVRHVVSHLLMPYEMSVPSFLARMVRSRFSFDRVADGWATRDRRSDAELVDALRRTADRAFHVPGAPAEAPLSHLVLHSQDVYRPLGLSDQHDPHPRAAAVVLAQLTTRRPVVPGLIEGVTVHASDTGWRTGQGPEVTGRAAALLTTLAGRTAALDELSGGGVDVLRSRLVGR